MAELLIEGSRGEEVRRLQRNLNVALAGQVVIVDGYNVLPLETQTGIFGKRTKAAVERFQRDFKLKKVDGKVGDETRGALATRVLLIEGTVVRNPNPTPTKPVPPPPTPPPPRVIVVPPPPTPPPATKSWLFQAQPALGLTPPPFISSSSGPGSSVVQGQVTMGIVYRTASEGPHWEFGAALQPSFNSQNSATDPRYTLQLQGSATFADPYRRGRFHTALFGQVLLISNLAPASLAGGVQLGGQISVDIIDDKWNLYSQAGVQALGQWTLSAASGGNAGQVSFGPVFTILGTTIQWDIK
jgi:peptidoglycan hydrolase-like protein with peptidoglycan-binding domain